MTNSDSGQRGQRVSELFDVGKRDHHAEVGDTGHDKDRPRLVGAMNHCFEISNEPLPCKVAIGRDDTTLGDRDGCIMQFHHHRVGPERVAAHELHHRCPCDGDELFGRGRTGIERGAP